MWRHLSPERPEDLFISDGDGQWLQTLNKRMSRHLVEELLQAQSPLLDELRLEDAVVAGDEGKLLGERLAWQGGHHDLNRPGQFISQPLKIT